MCTHHSYSTTLHLPLPKKASHSVLLCPLSQVQLGVTRAARGSGQGHQRLRWCQLPLVWQHHRNRHPDRTHVQTVPSDGQHEWQLLPQCDLGCAHQQQQHTHVDPHHQGPELHHLACGHELYHQGRTITERETHTQDEIVCSHMRQTLILINHSVIFTHRRYVLPSLNEEHWLYIFRNRSCITHTDWLWCNHLPLHFSFLV